jgi:TonB family protein
MDKAPESQRRRRRRGPLWATVGEDERQTLPLWQALLIAAALELLVPLLLFGVDWSFLPLFEPAPVLVMTVELKEPPSEPPPPPPEHERKREPQRKRPPRLEQVEVELPKPLPGEAPPRITMAKPKPEPVPKKEEELQPEPEPEAPPLPSVFQDVKPVRKVKIKYPPEAEAQHIEGRVRVRLSVDLDGNVTDARVLLAEPPGVFEQAVLEGVRQYKFKKDGTTYEADQEVIFKIDP